MNIRAYINALDAEFAGGKSTEHSHRPALKILLESAAPGALATNEPRQIECGAPDFLAARKGIPFGFVEAKDIGKNLDDKSYRAQFDRYAAALDNLIITDYLEFRLLVDGARVAAARVGEVRGGRIKALPANFAALEELLAAFAGYQGVSIASADDLAGHMAAKTRMLAETIAGALAEDMRMPDAPGTARGALHGEFKAFQKHLIHDITPANFADVYAQTVAYGMLAARLHDETPGVFTREKAATLIPPANPFLRKFFQHIAGYDLDKRIVWVVDSLADLFRAADAGELMAEYGKATRRTDPFLHFYETFLSAYNPKERKSRGVYYTPEPVVDFIVRAVDAILRDDFGLDKGLASAVKTQTELHKVQILDPATGTGTFLAAIAAHIHEKYFARQQGLWQGYVREDLLPRLNGFEILMAPYVMAHIKLEMALRKTGCELGEERARIFLTNALEESEDSAATLFSYTEWFLNEARQADFIKSDAPVMVVIGNPPYHGISSNMNDWINGLIEKYKYVDGEHFGEKKHWLLDDYVKFIRYGQYHIDRTGEGVLAYINNNGFLDNPTFRGMRWNLLQSFDKIYIVDLHGSSRKKETAPDGSVDDNVFEILQGVSINLFVKTGKKKNGAPARVFHCDLYGRRESKYDYLQNHELSQVDFEELSPAAPFYFFVPKNWENEDEYNKGFAVSDLFSVHAAGVVTARDKFAIDMDKKELLKRIADFTDASQSDDAIREKYFGNSGGKKYPPGDSRGWKMGVARKKIQNHNHADLIRRINYRPFDDRFIYYHPGITDWGREKSMRHMLAGDNAGLLTSRIFAGAVFNRVFITRLIADAHSASDQTYLFPLYLYPETAPKKLDGKPARKPNLDPAIVAKVAAATGLHFTPEKESGANTFAPIDLLDYIYAVLHARSYRARYGEFLKIDFPRVPYPAGATQFWNLAALGGELRALHLMESNSKLITTYPLAGDNIITTRLGRDDYEITEQTRRAGRVRINAKQYFGDVPEVAWRFVIGGYQPAQKWLKDRRGRALSHHDILHYQKIIAALSETARVMTDIEKTFGKS